MRKLFLLATFYRGKNWEPKQVKNLDTVYTAIQAEHCLSLLQIWSGPQQGKSPSVRPRWPSRCGLSCPTAAASWPISWWPWAPQGSACVRPKPNSPHELQGCPWIGPAYPVPSHPPVGPILHRPLPCWLRPQTTVFPPTCSPHWEVCFVQALLFKRFYSFSDYKIDISFVKIFKPYKNIKETGNVSQDPPSGSCSEVCSAHLACTSFVLDGPFCTHLTVWVLVDDAGRGCLGLFVTPR